MFRCIVATTTTSGTGLASVASKEAQNTAGIVFHLKRFVLVSHDRVLVISKVFMSVPVEHSGLFFTEIG